MLKREFQKFFRLLGFWSPKKFQRKFLKVYLSKIQFLTCTPLSFSDIYNADELKDETVKISKILVFDKISKGVKNDQNSQIFEKSQTFESSTLLTVVFRVDVILSTKELIFYLLLGVKIIEIIIF